MKRAQNVDDTYKIWLLMQSIILRLKFDIQSVVEN